MPIYFDEKMREAFAMHHFFNKKYQCIRLLSHKTLNKLVKLTMLCTTGPRAPDKMEFCG